MTTGHWGPCCSAEIDQRWLELRQLIYDEQLTFQSPLFSPMMAAGSKFKSSRLKSVLISLAVKSFLSLQKIVSHHVVLLTISHLLWPPVLRGLLWPVPGVLGVAGRPQQVRYCQEDNMMWHYLLQWQKRFYRQWYQNRLQPWWFELWSSGHHWREQWGLECKLLIINKLPQL
jgi:hypothetical protein